MVDLNAEPLISADTHLPELTFKAIIIAIILAVLLAAANTYLALKIGSTISASIPASVLAIGILRFFKNHNVLECNIIQTAASAGEGVAASVAFILPAMIVIGFWHRFEFWESTLASLLGGLLGVLFSIPLRRVMLNMSTLPYPEGTAVGNVLITSTKKGAFLRDLVYGGAVGGLISFCQTGLKLISDSLQFWRSWSNGVFGFAIGFTPAMLAAGYIIGVEVGITIFVGLIIGWIIVLPLIAHHVGVNLSMSAYDYSQYIWARYLRFVGVGNMLVGGIWTLITLLGPVTRGLRKSWSLIGKSIDQTGFATIPRTERDISMRWVIVGSIAISVIIFIFIAQTIAEYNLTHSFAYLLFVTVCSILYVIIIGFMLAVVCGYFTGLIGSTNNPLSGILIIALLLLTLLYEVFFSDDVHAKSVAAVVILIATVVATIASISNENLQDLKAGKMVGATPWKQQVMLAIGVTSASFILAPVLNLLLNAYGMAGVFPRPGMDKSQMLAAPQAGIMSAIIKGILGHKLDWNMILIGCGIAVIVIIVDEFLKRRNYRLPALAVGLGIYLPPEVTTPMIIGGFLSYFIKRSIGRRYPEDEAKKRDAFQRGILLACGMVAGSALMGVILAIPFVIVGSSDALAIVSQRFVPYATLIGILVIIALCAWFYQVCRSKK